MGINTMNQGKQSKSAKQRSMTCAAMAVALLFGGLSFSANAMVLGAVRVNSALGEPLKAEVTITDLTKDEAASLQVSMAAPADFGSRGLIYNSVLSSIRVSYEITGKDTAVVRFTSSRPIQEPFIDLLMDVRWRAGNMQRSYTMLIDPPRTILAPTNTGATTMTPATQVSGFNSPSTTSMSSAQPLTNTSSGSSISITARHYDANGHVIGSEALGSRAGGTAPQNNTGPSSAPRGATSTQSSVPQQSVTPSRSTENRSQPNSAQFSGAMTVKVSRGQTLGQIANATKPAGVTTEQMLVALYRANPSAFIHRNMNWVKAGATLVIPSDSEIASISAAEARREVSAHAREFNARVSGSSQAPRVESPTQQSSIGGITQQNNRAEATRPELIIDSGRQNTASVDQGTLINIQRGQEQARQDEIRSNIDNLGTIAQQIGTPSQTNQPPVVPTPPLTTEPEVAPVVIQPTQPSIDTNTGVQTGPLVVNTGTEPQQGVDAGQQNNAQPETSGGSMVMETVVETIPEVVLSEPDPMPLPEPQPLPRSFIDELLDNPLIPLAGVGALLIAVGGGVFVMRRRKKAKEEDEYYEDEDEDDTSADSFFAENHSQQSSNMLDQSSSIYAASQLDTNADVDPVQEADVYLAYGRDEQAAEILRDALLEEPDRVALHAKLCEVYARQNNVTAFDEQAAQLRGLTFGEGPEWTRIVRLAQNISPNNPLYTDTIETKALDGGKVAAAAAAAAAVAASEPLMNSRQRSVTSPDSHMMDASELLGGGSNTNEEEAEPDPDDEYDDDASLDVSLELDGHDTQVNDLNRSSSVFDEDDEEGPSTRLALAEEFYAIGNKKDAKEIIEEVLAQDVPAEVRQKASSLLNKVS